MSILERLLPKRRTPLTDVIEDTAASYVRRRSARSVEAIGQGLCIPFAAESSAMAKARGIPDVRLVSLSDGRPQPLPDGPAISHLESLDVASVTHTWLAQGDISYDAECPAGAASPYDLPFIRHALADLVRMRTPEAAGALEAHPWWKETFRTADARAAALLFAGLPGHAMPDAGRIPMRADHPLGELASVSPEGLRARADIWSEGAFEGGARVVPLLRSAAADIERAHAIFERFVAIHDRTPAGFAPKLLHEASTELRRRLPFVPSASPSALRAAARGLLRSGYPDDGVSSAEHLAHAADEIEMLLRRLGDAHRLILDAGLRSNPHASSEALQSLVKSARAALHRADAGPESPSPSP